MIQVDAKGNPCPIPVVKTKQAIANLGAAGGVVETTVDNEIAVQNLTKMANQKGWAVQSEKKSDTEFVVQITVGEGTSGAAADIPDECPVPKSTNNVVVALSSGLAGDGIERLGAVLMKGFIFALTSQDVLPATILCYNGGAFLSCKGSESLEDLKTLEAQGVEILTCGTCLDFYGLKDKLAVGQVTNMYTIAEKLMLADHVVKP